MKLNDTNFQKAVNIITSYCSTTKLSFNVPIRDNYGNVYPILLHEATPGLVENLIKEGFLLGVTDKGVYIDKY